MIIKFQRCRIVLCAMVGVCLAIIIIVTLLCTGLLDATSSDGDGREEELLEPPDMTRPPPPSKYTMGQFSRGAIVANGAPCADIANKILMKYGCAVDAAIAAMICDGVTCPQNMGIGGGFLMTVYLREQAKAYFLNARETAPGAAHFNMFNGRPLLSQIGGLAVGVPGELRGYEAVYKRFGGKAPWRELFEDTIALCRSGITVNRHLADTFDTHKKSIQNNPTLAEVFLNDNGEVPSMGDMIRMPKLADTLAIVADHGADAIYNGSLTKQLVEEIRAAGGIITEEDMANYQVRWSEPAVGDVGGPDGGFRIFSANAPGSGPLLVFMLRLLTQEDPAGGKGTTFVPSGDSYMDVHRITETFKFTYGRRTLLGDPQYVNLTDVLRELSDNQFIRETILTILKSNKTSEHPDHYGARYYIKEDHGTANLAVIGPNGDAVAATSTINLIFGSKLVSRSTGIVLNNEMDDFSSPSITNYFGVPPSKVNFIEPGKRPLSSMCPTIIVDRSGDVRLVIGAAGGTKITTATALATLWHLYFNRTIKEAIDAPRFHHQLYPMVWNYEYGTTKDLVDHMRNEYGHATRRVSLSNMGSCITGIATENSPLTSFRNASRDEYFATILAYFDPRRPGSWAGM